jgi:hypothetical protein
MIRKIFFWKLENFPGVAVSIQGSSPLLSLDFDVVVWTDIGELARGAPVRALKIKDVDNDVLEVGLTRRDGRPALPRGVVLLCSNKGDDIFIVVGKIPVILKNEGHNL